MSESTDGVLPLKQKIPFPAPKQRKKILSDTLKRIKSISKEKSRAKSGKELAPGKAESRGVCSVPHLDGLPRSQEIK